MEVLVVRTLLPVQVSQDLLGQLYVLLGFLESGDVFVHQSNVAYGHSRIMVVIVSIARPEDLYGLVVMSNRYVTHPVP